MTIQDVCDAKVAVKTTYVWEFEPALVNPGYRGGVMIKSVQVSIEREDGWDSDFIRSSCYGIQATKAGKPDGRGSWSWYTYPGPGFTDPYERAALAAWEATHGDFREEVIP